MRKPKPIATHWISAIKVRDILLMHGFVLDSTATLSGISAYPDGITAAQIMEMNRMLEAIPEDASHDDAYPTPARRSRRSRRSGMKGWRLEIFRLDSGKRECVLEYQLPLIDIIGVGGCRFNGNSGDGCAMICTRLPEIREDCEDSPHVTKAALDSIEQIAINRECDGRVYHPRFRDWTGHPLWRESVPTETAPAGSTLTQTGVSPPKGPS